MDGCCIERADDGGAFGGCQFRLSVPVAAVPYRGVSWDGVLPLARYDGLVITDETQTFRAVLRRPPSLRSGMIHRDGAPGLRRRIRGLAPTLFGIGMILVVSCAPTNHYLKMRDGARIAYQLSAWKPGKLSPTVGRSGSAVARRRLPTVLVFPEEERTASDAWSHLHLAARVVAIAAGYQRRIEENIAEHSPGNRAATSR
jgi:hypothetical protein